MTTTHQRLLINIDHIATVRQARGGIDPAPVEAVRICEGAGADGVTAHLREDRRHMQDADIELIAAAVTTRLNLEIACTAEMIALAERLRPQEVTFVPERRQEVTTEGGLDVAGGAQGLARALRRLRDSGIRVSLFIDPDRESISRSHDLGVDAVELHTGRYARGTGDSVALETLREGARFASSLGVAVHAGHGLTLLNVEPVAAIREIEELNIGHHVIARAIFVGLANAIGELRTAMDGARHPG